MAAAVDDLKEVASSTSSRTEIKGDTVDVTDYPQVCKAINEPPECPDVVFCCAGNHSFNNNINNINNANILRYKRLVGASLPGWFLQQPIQELYDGMQLNYFGAVHVARAAASRMVAANKPGRIVFISSTVGLMGMIGYSQYAPTKWALRGLAECLNQEFFRHRITFHVYFVASIRTAGFAREEERKPEITRLLEGSDVSGDQSPRARAACLIDGLKGNQQFVTSDFFTRILLATSEGFNLRLKEVPVAVLGWLVLPLVRIYFKVTIMRSPHFNQAFVR